MNKRIFVSADLHYDHVNIVKGTSTWKNASAQRDFNSVEEMNMAIIESINSTVTSYDELYLLGDISLKNMYSTVSLIKKINCKNIHLILGNHDQSIRDNKKFKIIISEGILAEEFLGKTLLPGNTYYFTMKELFVSVNQRVELNYNDKKFILDHYPLETWNQAMHGAIMVHGHVHGALDISDTSMFYRRLDADWGKFRRPLSLDEIDEMMKDRKNLEY